MGKQKPKASIIAQTSAKAVDSSYARICLSNLLDSYYLTIIFSEPSLDIKFITVLLPEEKFKQN